MCKLQHISQQIDNRIGSLRGSVVIVVAVVRLLLVRVGQRILETQNCLFDRCELRIHINNAVVELLELTFKLVGCLFVHALFAGWNGRLHFLEVSFGAI